MPKRASKHVAARRGTPTTASYKKSPVAVDMGMPVPQRITAVLKAFRMGLVNDVPEDKLALICGYTNPISPSYAKHMRALKKEGVIEAVSGGGDKKKKTCFRFTAAALASGNWDIAEPRDNAELHDRIKSLLEGRGADQFDLIHCHEKQGGITRQELAAELKFGNVNSPSFIQPLRNMLKQNLVTEEVDHKSGKMVLRLTERCFME